MGIGEISQEELSEIAIKALLKHRNMTEDEICEAWKQFWGMCVDSILAQMVVDGKASMEWKDNKLYFSVNKEGLCKK